MPLEKFISKITKLTIRDSIIVKLAYKYKREKEYTISNEILVWDYYRNKWVWLNDWDEGQEDVKVCEWVFLDDVFRF